MLENIITEQPEENLQEASSAVHELLGDLTLEEQVAALTAQNSSLKEENSSLKKELHKTKRHKDVYEKFAHDYRDVYKEEKYNAEYDTLTNALSRRKLDADLKGFIEEFETDQEDFTVAFAILDFDWFKTVNNLGHRYGDAILQKAVKIVRNEIRANGDDVYRYGGEEFVIIMRVDSEVDAEQLISDKIQQIAMSLYNKAHLDINDEDPDLIESLRNDRIKSLKKEFADDPLEGERVIQDLNAILGHVTASFATTTYSVNADTIEDLKTTFEDSAKAAAIPDDLLTEAKEIRRGCITDKDGSVYVGDIVNNPPNRRSEEN